MTAGMVWVGTTAKMVEVPAPDMDVPVSMDGFSDGLSFENGGQTLVRSAAAAKTLGFAFSIQAASNLAKWRDIRQGALGSGLLYLSDPMSHGTNALSASWAAPGLIEQGWPSIYDAAPTFANTAANSYGQPLRSATFTITQAANTAPTYQSSRFIIPIPPGMTLNLGVSGSATGTGVVYVTAYNIAAGTSSGGALTLLSPTGSTRLNATYSSAAYDYAAVDLRRTSSAASTVTIASMLAQLYTTGASVTLTGNHVPGEGATGFRMRGWDETYGVLTNRSGKFSLVEIGAWLR